jgi:hypothetical protein
MRNYQPNENSVQRRDTRGRAVLYGYGTDIADGHFRYTKAGAVDLYGGSEQAHSRMQARALRIQRELDEQGICLASMTYEQFTVAKAIVEKANRE